MIQTEHGVSSGMSMVQGFARRAPGRVMVVGMLVSALAWWSACREEDSGCEKNSDCPVENRCRASRCVAGCDQDTDCSPGKRCEFNACVEARQQTDGGSTVDASVIPDAASAPDAGTTDDASASHVDIGEPCQNTEQCGDEALCVGPPLLCRKKCQVNGTDCDSATERCITVTLRDGGMAPTGVCVTGGTPGAACNPGWCAELYVCVAGMDAVYKCRDRCDPSAADAGRDAGCPPNAPRCIFIRNEEGGACLP